MPKTKMQIVYHGTDEATAKKILKTGFKQGTFFATDLKHALGYGGSYIFEVAVPSDIIPKVPDWEFEGMPPLRSLYPKNAQYWEFVSDYRIPPSKIVRLTKYPKGTALAGHKKKAPMMVMTTSTKNRQGNKIMVGVGYSDRKGCRLSRKQRKSFKKVRYT